MSGGIGLLRSGCRSSIHNVRTMMLVFHIFQKEGGKRVSMVTDLVV